MKLYACFTVFDSLELLDHSIENILPFVEGVIICYQEISNKGNRSDKVGKFLEMYEDVEGIRVVKYFTDMTLGPKENERRKHQLMLTKARESGATHFIMMAADHFYPHTDLWRGIQFLKANDDVCATFTQMFTYYKKPEWQLDPPETYYMPFICKLLPTTKIERIRNYPLLVDPSVQVNTIDKYHVFPLKEIALHHYSVVRKDQASILEKFENAASPWTPEQIKDFTEEFMSYDLQRNVGIKYFSGRKVKLVDDFFALNRIFRP